MSDAGSTADFDRGRRVGKYEILTRLSIGGMAELFLAYTSGPGGFRKFVAVKQILPDVKKDPQFVQMFLDEARITAALSHANIGQVFDLGQEDGELYLAMEFISGQNLEQVVKLCAKQGKAIPYGFSARVVMDACLGLHYAHAFVEPSGKPLPVIHRDVSPKNVMVTYQGNIKVIDFGIAKAKGRLGRTQVGIVKGTSGYMSPEQVRNEPLDGRSDLFAAGVILYELLTGQRLFTGNSDAAMMIKISDQDTPDPRTLNPRAPPGLSEVAMRALKRGKAERYATGKELAKAIEAAAGSALHDEDQVAAFMRELFEEKMNKTRALLDFASQTQDVNQLESAAGALREEAEPVVTTPRPKPRPKKASDAPVLPKPLTAKSPPLPDTDENTAPPQPPTRQEKGAQRYASKVATDYALYSDSDAETQQERSERNNPFADVEETTKGPRHPRPVVAQPTVEATATGPRPGGWGGRLMTLLVLAAIGGLGASVKVGPLQPYVGPQYDKLAAFVHEQISAEPPTPTTMQPLKRPALPTQATSLIEKEKAAAEQERKREALAAASPPAPEKPLPPVTPKDQVDAKERSRESEKSSKPAKKTGSSTRSHSSGDAPGTFHNDGEVEVVDTRSKSSAARGGIGFLTLATVPPAQVYDGATDLGISPLLKVPLPAGTYKLRLVDPEGQPRTLSAPIKPGEVTSLKIRVEDLPLEK